MKGILLAALIVVSCLWQPASALALDQKEALRGLNGVKVLVENLPPDIERAGLTKNMVQNLVEQKLCRLGVKVLAKPKPPAMSTLYINPTILWNKPRNFLVYGINVMLFEYAYLKRDIGSVGDLREVHAVNWFKGTVGYLGPPFAQELLKKIEEMVNLFLTDYLAVNPR